MKYIALALVLGLVAIGALPVASGTNDVATLALVVLVVAGLGLYFVPTLAAYQRRHPSAAAVAAVNLFLGWSLVGWVAALAWSLSGGNARGTTSQ